MMLASNWKYGLRLMFQKSIKIAWLIKKLMISNMISRWYKINLPMKDPLV